MMRLECCDMFDAGGFGSISPNSVSAIITDFPYGVLNKRSAWDTLIDFDRFWVEAKKALKPNGVVISTAVMPFTAYLVSTNYKDFKYTLVWEKSKATGYLNAKKQPMRAHEDIVVFCDGQPTYNPQMVKGLPYNKGHVRHTGVNQYGVHKDTYVVNTTGLRYPRSVQYFRTAESEGKYHPVQKPVALFEWLIKTYTNKGDLVVDPCMGSGTTGVACINCERSFIGFEMDPVYYKSSCERILGVVNEGNE